MDKKGLAEELVIAKEENTKLADELVIARLEKADRAAELVIAKKEKADRANELIIANKELVFQNKEKQKRAAELVIADAEKADRLDELIVAKKLKSKRAFELIIANKELVYQNEEKANRANELVIAKADKSKRADELVIADAEKAKRSDELIVANKELAFQNREKEKRAEELIIANKELAYQNEEKQKRAEELIMANNELKQLLQLNADKNRFISILGHDLKSPFNNLLGLSELLTKNIHNYDIDKIEKFVNDINISARNAHNLLEDILMWASSQQGSIVFKPQNLSLTDICKNILEPLNPTANEKNIIINYSSLDHLTVYADADMLKTVLRNLVSNAIKFTNGGGVINITAEQTDSNLTISVSDNGIGIPPDDLKKLFDISEFLTTKGTRGETGTGLGLLLCKEFVEKHGGKIWVESVEGKGSEFRFIMPLK